MFWFVFSKYVYKKKKLHEKVLFSVFFPLIATPKQAQMHAESILKIRKKQNKACFNSKKGSLS